MNSSEFLIYIAVSAIIALIICLTIRNGSRSVSEGKEADRYAEGGLHLGQRMDLYTHSVETRRHIEQNPDSDRNRRTPGRS